MKVIEVEGKSIDEAIKKAADMLGIQRSHLYNKLKKYEIEKE